MTTNETGFQDDFLDSMLGDFIDESDGLLEQLNDNLLQLDDWVKSLDDGANQRCDDDLLNEMFRAAHSLKGLSAMLRLDDINLLTHKMENVFEAARSGQLYIQADTVELVFRSVDMLGLMIQNLKEPGSGGEVDADPVIQGIQEVLHANNADKERGDQSDIERALNDIQAEQENEQEPAAESTPEPTEQAVESQLDEISRVFESIVDETEIQANFLAIFIDEATQSVEDLSDMLLGERSTQSVEDLLITCHRIKGSAASIGLNRVAKLTHLMEDTLQELFDNNRELPADLVDPFLACTDAIRAYVEALKQGTTQDDDFESAYADLAKAIATLDNSGPSEEHAPDDQAQAESQEDPGISPDGSALTDEQLDKVAALAHPNSPGWIISAQFDKELRQLDLKAILVIEHAKEYGEIYFCAPDEPELEQLQESGQLVIGLHSTRPADEIINRLSVDGIESVDLHPLPANEANSTQLEESEAETLDLEESQAAEESVEPEESAKAPEETGKEENTAAEPEDTIAEDTTAEPSPEAKLADVPSDTTSAKTVAEKDPTPVPNEKTSEASPTVTTVDAEPTKESTPSEEAKPATPQQRTKPTETLRVDIDRLDQLMNLAGQLVINKARFVQISNGLRHLSRVKQMGHAINDVFSTLDRIDSDASDDGLEESSPEMADRLRSNTTQLREDLDIVRNQVDELVNVRGAFNDLTEAVHQLDRVADGIQKSVMDTRMVPIGPLFSRFKRVIRDLTRGTPKDVRLELQGEKTELDKCMIDKLGDPVIHMVRNSVDHGIEMPEDRIAKGKPAFGTVCLNAFHRGNRIVIEIKDDGKGLDADRIREKAISKGVISANDAEKMTPHQLCQLIWEPGFSTAEQVTEISGRGMGMDIVRSKVEEMNGTIEVDSEFGKGTCFTIRLPLTMAILPSLLAEISGDVFAIPVESVVEIVRIPKSKLGTVCGQTTAVVRGRVISIVSLHEIFNWNSLLPSFDAADQDVTLVVVGADNREAGLLVNGLLGEEDVVIKSLAENYLNVYGVAGASILGDGRVSLILDVGGLLEMSCRPRSSFSSNSPLNALMEQTADLLPDEDELELQLQSETANAEGEQ